MTRLLAAALTGLLAHGAGGRRRRRRRRRDEVPVRRPPPPRPAARVRRRRRRLARLPGRPPGRPPSRSPGAWSCSTPATSSATPASRGRSTGWCPPAASARPATPPAPPRTAASPRPPSPGGSRGSCSAASSGSAPGCCSPARSTACGAGGRASTSAVGPATHVGRDREPADLKVSLHADGSYARGARGFHVILPADRRPWTHDIARPSRRLGLDLRRALRAGGFRTATYTAGGDGIDVRADLGTLNLSDIPTVMVELGNMRHRARGPPDGHPPRPGGVRAGTGGRDPQPPVVTRWAWPDRVIAPSLPSRDLASPSRGRRSRPECAAGR